MYLISFLYFTLFYYILSFMNFEMYLGSLNDSDYMIV